MNCNGSPGNPGSVWEYAHCPPQRCPGCERCAPAEAQPVDVAGDAEPAFTVGEWVLAEIEIEPRPGENYYRSWHVCRFAENCPSAGGYWVEVYSGRKKRGARWCRPGEIQKLPTMKNRRPWQARIDAERARAEQADRDTMRERDRASGFEQRALAAEQRLQQREAEGQAVADALAALHTAGTVLTDEADQVVYNGETSLKQLGGAIERMVEQLDAVRPLIAAWQAGKEQQNG